MKIIVVSGTQSNVGKTSVATGLLRYLSGWSALKVTVNKGKGCSRKTGCGICASIKKPFSIVKNKRIINQSGKDTARLKQAGAKEVIWLKARPEGLKQGIDKALLAFSSCRGIIIEGTSVLKFITPDIHIHLQG